MPGGKIIDCHLTFQNLHTPRKMKHFSRCKRIFTLFMRPPPPAAEND